MTNTREHKGVVLKQARESKGIGLDSVHEATKIPLDALKAIEEGYTIRSLSPFYYRGFLKIYAKYLDVDLQKVVEDYQPELPPTPQYQEIQQSQLEERLSKFLTKQNKRLLLQILGIVVALFVVVKLFGFVKNIKFHKPVKKVERKIARSIQSVKEERTKKTPAVSVASAPEIPKPSEESKEDISSVVEANAFEEQSALPAAAIVAEEQLVSLTVRAKRNCWLQVEVDGNMVFQSAFKKGLVETWKADERIELTGKNLNQLEFEVNGKTLGPLSKIDGGANKVVVTKNGLSVER